MTWANNAKVYLNNVLQTNVIEGVSISLGRETIDQQSQVRIDVPGFSATGIVSRNTGTVVNVNVSGAVDKISTARTVVSAVNKATKSVTSTKFNGSSIMGAKS